MSFASSKVSSLMNDLTRIQSSIASVARDEARQSEKIASAGRRLGNKPSPSSATSIQREIQRANEELARLQGKRASFNNDLARKQSDLARAQKSLMDEQQKDLRKNQDLLAKLEKDARQKTTSALSQIKRSYISNPIIEPKKYSAFISHASEDKDDVARPLAEALKALGHSVWFDEVTLKIGDSLRRSIDQGLIHSKFGIVILSPSFFSKNWPQYELDGLVTRENSGQEKVILPLWHKVSKNEVLNFSPTLADRLGLSTSQYTIEELASEIHEVLGAKT